MSAECKVRRGEEEKVWECGRCSAALQTSLHCSSAEEVSPMQAMLLPKVLGKSANEGCLS